MSEECLSHSIAVLYTPWDVNWTAGNCRFCNKMPVSGTLIAIKINIIQLPADELFLAYKKFFSGAASPIWNVCLALCGGPGSVPMVSQKISAGQGCPRGTSALEAS